MKPSVLLVDDEESLRKVLTAILKRDGYDVTAVASGKEAIGVLKEHRVDALITDLQMPEMNGMDLLKYSIENYPDLPVIIITAYGTVDTAVEALKLGAIDYISKPFEYDELHPIIKKAVKIRQLDEGEVKLDKDLEKRPKIIGNTPEMLEIFDIIEKVAASPSNVLISGETGTGKNLIAKAIHVRSPRKNSPFIKVNCSAIPETLIESELFGYEKGAFTGAVSSKPGRFELADKGTLFLDEIGELIKPMQVKLLRVIQEHEFERVGGLKTIHVDLRLISATNKNLYLEIQNKRFRSDLFYRLNVVPIHIPPLRQRRQDIPLLINFFMRKYSGQLGKPVTKIDPLAESLMMQYPWPGNIRELENLIERTILFCEGDSIKVSDLPPEISKTVATAADGTRVETAESLKDFVRHRTSEMEKQMIVRMLEETDGNVTKAAKKLKISRKSLQIKMKEYGLRGRF